MNSGREKFTYSTLTALFFVIALAVLTTAGIFTYLLIEYRTKDLLDRTDAKLLTAAELTREIISPDYHDRIYDKSSVSEEQFRQIVNRNDDLCRRLSLQYLWSVLVLEDRLVFTSATHSDLNDPNSSCATFFEKHNDPKAFDPAIHPKLKTSFSSFQNEWGAGRMVLIPRKDKHGRIYIFGASVQLTELQTMIRKTIISSIEIGIVVICGAFLLALGLAKSFTVPIEKLTMAADHMATGDLNVSLDLYGLRELRSLSSSLDTMRRGMIKHLTSLRESESALRESESRLKLAHKIAKIGYWEWEVATNELKWSENVYDIFGRNKQEFRLTVESFESCIPEDDFQQFVEDRKIALEKNETIDIEHRIKLPDGSIRHVHELAEIIRNEVGEVIKVLGTVQDITERKKMENLIQQSQKMEAIGTLAGGIAHDFNNMLGVVTGNVSYALSSLNSNDELFKILSNVLKGTNRAQNLTHQLLTFAKGGAPIKKVCSINKLLKESAEFVTSGAKSRCEFKLADDLWSAEIDPNQIHQVISNLIINADQSMPNGGIITISAENKEISRSNEFPIPAGQYVQISIEDKGIGIPKDYLPNIFDPYFTTKQKGSGLGLATAYSIIKKHGGHIMVYSEIGKGTVFNVYLPASSKQVEKSRASNASGHSGQGKILVMDDQEPILEMAEKILNKIGYETEIAQDGAKAVELYQNAHESDKPFNLVILDLTVPGGMGGAETIQALRELDPNVKAVVSSGYSNDPIMANFRDYGFIGVMPKPYTEAQLAELLKSVFTSSY